MYIIAIFKGFYCMSFNVFFFVFVLIIIIIVTIFVIILKFNIIIIVCYYKNSEEQDLQFKNYLKEEPDPGLIIINKTRNRAV